MASNNWMEDFFGTSNTQNQSKIKSQEDIEKDERLKKIKIHNNKCFRKLLTSLYVRILFTQWLFDESRFKGINTIRFNDLNISELNKICDKCRVWIDKIGGKYKWKENKSIEVLNDVKEYVNNIYHDRQDDEYVILSYSTISNLLTIDLKALIYKSIAINAMVSNLLLSEDLVIKLHKYALELVHTTDEYVKHISDIYSELSEEEEMDIDNKYNLIHSKLEKVASFNVTLKNINDKS